MVPPWGEDPEGLNMAILLKGTVAERVLSGMAELRFRVARTRQELEDACHVVYEAYKKAGYMADNPARMRLDIYHALPQTITFIAKLRRVRRVVATVSLVPDSPLGLPMDRIYSEEMRRLRAAGRKVAEVSMLADRRQYDFGVRTLGTFLGLTKMLFDYATQCTDLTDLCIAVNPHHEQFYTRYLAFEDLGGLTVYSAVRNNPAVGKRLDLSRVEQICTDIPRLRHIYLERRIGSDCFGGKLRLSQADLAYLFVEKSDLLTRLPQRKLQYLRAQYPGYDFDAILADGRSRRLEA